MRSNNISPSVEVELNAILFADPSQALGHDAIKSDRIALLVSCPRARSCPKTAHIRLRTTCFVGRCAGPAVASAKVGFSGSNPRREKTSRRAEDFEAARTLP